MSILYAFIFGGLICMLCQIVTDKLKLPIIYITCSLVVIGGLLEINNIYDRLIDIGGFGFGLPISSFGHLVCHGVFEEIEINGFMGIFKGVFKYVNVGIIASIFFSFLFSLVSKPKG